MSMALIISDFNVGDLKPMEMNISYFLDMAYDYDTWGTNGKDKITEYRKNWVKQQFGENTSDSLVNEMEKLLDDYTWLNGSGKRNPSIRQLMIQ